MSHCWAGDALVVVADVARPCSAVRSPVTFMSGGAVLQRAELVEGRERRAGVVGLVAERPVELGGVPDRLVDGQPEVGRVDHQVVAAGLDRRAPAASRRAARAARASSASQSQPPPVRYSQPRPTGGARVRIESKTPVVRVDAPCASSSGCSRTRCWVVGCRRGRRRTCSPGPAAATAVDVVDAVGRRAAAAVQSASSADLLASRARRTGRRRTTRPRSTSACTGSGASSTRRGGHRRGDLRRPRPPSRRPGRPRRRSGRRRRRSPRRRRGRPGRRSRGPRRRWRAWSTPSRTPRYW